MLEIFSKRSLSIYFLGSAPFDKKLSLYLGGRRLRFYRGCEDNSNPFNDFYDRHDYSQDHTLLLTRVKQGCWEEKHNT